MALSISLNRNGLLYKKTNKLWAQSKTITINHRILVTWVREKKCILSSVLGRCSQKKKSYWEDRNELMEGSMIQYIKPYNREESRRGTIYGLCNICC